MATPPAVIAGIYVRISQDRQGKCLGVARQEEECRSLAKQLGWKVCEVYSDNDLSAFSGKSRPRFEAMLTDMETGQIGGLLCWHTDRLYRNMKDLERLIDIADAASVKIKTVNSGDLDLSTSAGKMMARILGSVSRQESEHKSERLRSQREQLAKDGGWRGGGARPYGFETDGVTPRPTEVAEIVRCTEAVVTWTRPGSEGQSLRALVRDLNERGISTATGRSKWTSATLRDVIMRPRNAGLSVYKGEVVGEACWDELVPLETWRAACAILGDPQRRTNGRGGTIKWLGSGLYICGVCSQPDLRVVGQSRGRRYYRCAARQFEDFSGHVSREAYGLDGYVEALLVARISDPRVLRRLGEVKGESADTKALRVELAALGTRQDKLGEMYAAGQITERVMASGMKEVVRRSGEIDAQLERAGRRTPLDPFKAARDASDVAAIWYGPGGPAPDPSDRSGGLSLGARRAVLDRLLTVTVDPAPRARIRRPDGSYLDRDAIGIGWK